jgi:hypothetical protein
MMRCCQRQSQCLTPPFLPDSFALSTFAPAKPATPYSSDPFNFNRLFVLNCQSITLAVPFNLVLQVLLGSGAVPLLADVNVASCPAVTDVGCIALLQVAHLGAGSHTTGHVTLFVLYCLTQGVQGCRRIESFDCSGNLDVSNATLLTAAAYCPLMHSLKVSGCVSTSTHLN